MNPCLYGQLIYDKGGKNIVGKSCLFPYSPNGVGNLDSYMQKNQTGLLSHTMHKNKFKID